MVTLSAISPRSQCSDGSVILVADLRMKELVPPQRVTLLSIPVLIFATYYFAETYTVGNNLLTS